VKLSRARYDPRWSRFTHADLDYLQTLHDLYPEEPEDVAIQFSRSMEDVFIGRFPKITHGSRLPKTETVLVKHLAPRRDAGLTAMDLGASDGSTTLSLLAALRRVSAEIIVFLTDKTLYLTEYRRGPIREYRAPDGAAVQLRIGRCAWRLPRPDHRWDLLSRGLVRLYFGRRRLRDGLRLTKRIPLVAPAAARDPAIHLLELDCVQFRPDLVDRFDVIRASNVLNGAYFSEPDLEAIASHLHRYLRDGGLLVVSRNPREEPGVENGTLWRREATGFAPVEDFGSGSEVRGLVERTSVPRGAAAVGPG
jgi:SAM-dependent methyltransferase